MTDPSASLPRRIGAYLNERFPVVPSFLTALLIAGTADLTGQAANGPEVTVDARTLLSTLMVFFALFVLRVLDEHKDFEEDKVAHPERVLQRGVVSLRLLDVMAVVATLALLVCAGSAGTTALGAAVVCLVYLGLMRAEFFVGGWLRRHIMLYALTHQLITPLLCAAVVVARTGYVHDVFDAVVGAQACVAAMLGLVFELGRKVKAPEEEIAGDDTYSSVFGPKTAAFLVMFFASLAFLGASFLVFILRAPVLAVAPAAMGTVVVVVAFSLFSRKVTAGRGKALLGAIALGALLTYVSVGLSAWFQSGWIVD